MFEYQLMTIKIKCDSSKPMMKNANLEKCGVFSSEFSNCFFKQTATDSTTNRGFSKTVIRCGEPIRLNQQTYASLAMAANGIDIDRGVPSGKLT